MEVFGTLRPAGLNLGPYAKADFENIRGLIDTATSEMLISPDWDTIMNIVDAVNSQRDPLVITEVFFYIRKKLVARNPRVVSQALTLSEALVKNSGAKVHRAVNDEAFMKTIERVARVFSDRAKKERNREVSHVVDQVLDLVQTWGEAFLPHRNRYPNIPEAYFNLRKEGYPFKTQFDPSRAPVFTPEVSAPRGSFDASADEALARAMQQSISLSDGPVPADRDRAASYSQYSSDDVLTVVAAAVEMLTSALDNATVPEDVKNNELVKEIVQQCEQLQGPLASLIERSVIENASGIEELFALNDSLQTSVQRYRDALQGKMQPPKPKPTTDSVDLLGDFGEPAAAPAPVAAPAQQPRGVAAPAPSVDDPFGFGLSQPAPAAAAPAPAVAQDPLDAFLSSSGVPASKPLAAPSPAPVKLAPPPSDTAGRARRATRSGEGELDIFGSSPGRKAQEQQAAAQSALAPAADDPFAALDAIASRHASVPGTTSTGPASAIDFLSVQPTQPAQPMMMPQQFQQPVQRMPMQPMQPHQPMFYPPQSTPQPQPFMSMPGGAPAAFQPPYAAAQQQQPPASSNPFDDLLGMSSTPQQPTNYYSQPRNTPF